MEEKDAEIAQQRVVSRRESELNGDEGVLSSLEILGLGVKLGNILCDCHSISLSPISFFFFFFFAFNHFDSQGI